MTMHRRAAIRALGLLPLAWTLPGKAADKYPAGPVRMIVPFPPGGTTDANGRIIAQALAQALGGNMVVENIAGAAGTIGTAQAKRAKPDGYTLLFGNISTQAISAGLYPDLPYDPLKDFAPIAHTGKLVNLLVVHPSLGVKSVPELIAYAKANPGKLSYGSSGIGGTPHLSAELFKQRTGTDMVHIPYKGGGPMLADLLGNQVQLSFANLPDLLPHVRAGKLIALGVTSRERWPSVPDIPSIQEQGVPDFDMTSWMGLFAPARVPAPIREQLVQATLDVQKKPEVIHRLSELGFVEEPMGGEAFSAYVAQQVKFWSTFVKTAGIKAE